MGKGEKGCSRSSLLLNAVCCCDHGPPSRLSRTARSLEASPKQYLRNRNGRGGMEIKGTENQPHHSRGERSVGWSGGASGAPWTGWTHKMAACGVNSGPGKLSLPTWRICGVNMQTRSVAEVLVSGFFLLSPINSSTQLSCSPLQLFFLFPFHRSDPIAPLELFIQPSSSPCNNTHKRGHVVKAGN